jgi:FkbM family methyltransferase
MDSSTKTMYKSIVEQDCYKLNNYPNNFFDAIVDIGANTGMFVLYAKIRHPFSNIFAYEPCKTTYTNLITNTWFLPNLKYFSQALGDGNPLVFYDTGCSIANLFYKNGEVMPQTESISQSYYVSSCTLTQIFDENKIKGKYLIKIDCEGGERFMLNDKGCIDIIKKSQALCIEVHFPPRRKDVLAHQRFGGFPDWCIWDTWMKENFAETHTIWYGFSDGRKSGHGTYILNLK